MTNIVWQDAGKVIKDPIGFGDLSALDVSTTRTITIGHDSQFSISECQLYISSITENYQGSRYATRDYDQLIWYGNNYPGFGMQIDQAYTASGLVEDYDGIRLVDLTRLEPVDIFTGSTIEILDGPFIGETTVVNDYDPDNSFFTIATPFSGDVTGATYKIDTTSTDIIKTKVGSSFEFPIPLLNKGGIIDRNETVNIDLILKVPKFSYTAAKLLVDFNLRFFSIEG